MAGNQDLPSQTALLVDFEATNQFVVVRTERSLLFASTFDCSGSGVGRGGVAVVIRGGRRIPCLSFP